MESINLSYINDVLTENNIVFEYLNTEKTITNLKLNNVLKTELIMFYFFLNKNAQERPEFDDIFEILNNNDYYIEDNYICSKDIKVSINDIIDLIAKYEKNKPFEEDVFYYKTTRVYNFLKDSKVIPFDQVRSILKKHHNNHLLNDDIILNDEIHYLEKMKYRTSTLLSLLINTLLQEEDLSSVDYTELQFLFGLSNIYTIITYLEDKTNLDTNCFNVSLANTCINKMIYDEKYIQELDNQMASISYHYDYVNSILNYYKHYVVDSEATVSDLQAKLDDIMRKEFELGIELIELKQNPIVFNKHFFTYMIASIKNGTIDYNNAVKDPLISFYDVEGRRLKCYFDIHLSDLLKIINNNDLLKNLNSKDNLKLEKKKA